MNDFFQHLRDVHCNQALLKIPEILYNEPFSSNLIERLEICKWEKVGRTRGWCRETRVSCRNPCTWQCWDGSCHFRPVAVQRSCSDLITRRSWWSWAHWLRHMYTQCTYSNQAQTLPSQANFLITVDWTKFTFQSYRYLDSCARSHSKITPWFRERESTMITSLCDGCDTLISWHRKGSILGTLQCPPIRNFERESSLYCIRSSSKT